jgi:hypothetical protein
MLARTPVRHAAFAAAADSCVITRVAGEHVLYLGDVLPALLSASRTRSAVAAAALFVCTCSVRQDIARCYTAYCFVAIVLLLCHTRCAPLHLLPFDGHLCCGTDARDRLRKQHKFCHARALRLVEYDTVHRVVALMATTIRCCPCWT